MTQTLRCRGWQQEAALRMLENNLHPDVAEKPEELVVYGGIGKAARNHACLAAIKRELIGLRDEETLLVQSGKPVAVFETHAAAPRVLIANSNLVGRWANWETFRELDAAGLMMYGQMTAGSWIYIGTQGILQGTYETFAAIGRLRFGGSLKGRLVVTAGLGGMGGAQPLAVTMNEGCALCIEVDLQRIERRIRERYLDERAGSLDDALDAAGGGAARGARALDRAARQRRRDPARARRARRRGRRRDRPDERARPAQRLRPGRDDARAGRRPARGRPGRVPEARRRVGARARRRDPRARRGGRGGVRLRQRPARAGRGARRRRRVRLPRLRPRLHPAAVLRGQGAVPLGRAVGRPGRHPRDRPRDPRPVRRPAAHPALDRAGERARRVPGPAGADLLARLRRAPPGRAAVQRARRLGRGVGADRDRPRPPGRGLGRVARSARPRRCATARTRSPTGRSSTRW